MDTDRVPRDVDVRLIALVGAGLAALTAVVLVALWFQLLALWNSRQRGLPPPSPLATALPDVPPEPRLETTAALELRALRAEEERRLHGYGWIDRSAGVVHIPIERAMELVAKEKAR